MTTWSSFLSDLRSDLQDTSTTPRWTDKMLYLYTKDAIRDYSTWFPKRIDRATLSLSASSYPLPVDFLDEIHVESPIDAYLEKRNVRPGTKYRSQSAPSYYFISGGNLYLNAAADEVYLTYYSSHPVPTSETDTTFVFTVPDADLELLRIYVKAKVYQQMRSRQSSLDRFKVGSGNRDDNPLLPETDTLMEDYSRGIAQRIPGGIITLYKASR